MNTACKINSIIAHDLRDSLSSISGVSDILIHNWKEFEEGEKLEILKEIRDISGSTMQLLSDLLDWSKKMEKITEPDIRAFEAITVFRMVNNHAKPFLKRKKVVITENFPAPVTIWGDENMFGAIIRNLLANAVKSCVNGGEIKFSYELTDAVCTFCISDNGIGMTKQQIDQLFPDTCHVAGTTGSAGYNNGFGLILCRDFLRINNGSLRAESSEGKGTNVYFSFPLPPASPTIK